MQELNTLVLVGSGLADAFRRLIDQARVMAPAAHASSSSDSDVTDLVRTNIYAVPGSGFRFAGRSRTLAEAVAYNRALRPRQPDLAIQRRGCHPSREWRQHFERGWLAVTTPDDATLVYTFRAPSAQFRDTLLRLVASYNLDTSKSGHDPIDVLLFRHVLESVSAGRIQCLWRGRRLRRRLAGALYDACRRRRAVSCLVQAWRCHLTRLRFRMLHQAKTVCDAIQTPAVFLSRPALDLVLTVPNPFRRLKLFPEHHSGFEVGPDQIEFCSPGAGDMRPVPNWLGIGPVPVSSVVGDDFTDDQLRSGLRDLTQVQTCIDLKAVASDRDRSETRDLLWMVDFPTLAQAKLRAFLLLVHTWEPITGTFCHARPAVCDRDGTWSVLGREIEPPSQYRDVPVFMNDTGQQTGTAVSSPTIPIYRSHLNPDGLYHLLRDIDRELSRADPEIAKQHGFNDATLHVLTEQATAIDDIVEASAFLLPDVDDDDLNAYDADVDSRMQWQAMNLQLDAFCPNTESGRDRAEIDFRMKLMVADTVRKESDHLALTSQTERQDDLAWKRKLAQTQRDLHHIRSNLNRIGAAKMDDHCQREISEQRQQNLQDARTLIRKIKMRRRQFKKEQIIEQRIARVRRHTERIQEQQELAEARAAAQTADRARVTELIALAQIGRACRANRDRIKRDGLHFRRQLCQISKQIRSAQAHEAASLRAALTARHVQEHKVRDACLRQNVHDRLLAEFNRKRQNAIVQQLRIRDQIEEKRNQEHAVFAKARSERRQMRQIQERIAEELATCRDVLRLDMTAHEYDDMASIVSRSVDAGLTSKLEQLEELANTVRLACTRIFKSA